MNELGSALQTFLLAFSALFSIVNPPGSALIFYQATTDRSHADRLDLARKVATYSAVVMLVSLWGGAYVLKFFGVSLDALRIAGGLVVAVRAWSMLSAPEVYEERKTEQASHQAGASDVAFFPLTMPFTTGPGTMAVSIALGSNMPASAPLSYVLGASVAALAIAVAIWIAYGSADRLVGWLGAPRARIVGRLTAFLLVCIGVQITLNGATAVLREVLHP